MLCFQESKSVRFDFEGNLIARNDDIPVYRGLHHHGDDDMAPGYTLDELFNLARSNYLQQKVFALKVLAKIMEKVLNSAKILHLFLFFACNSNLVYFTYFVAFVCY